MVTLCDILVIRCSCFKLVILLVQHLRKKGQNIYDASQTCSLLFAQRSQVVMEYEGMHVSKGLVPEIARVPKRRRGWAIPPELPMPHYSLHRGQPGSCSSSFSRFLGYFWPSNPAKNCTGCEPPTFPLFSKKLFFSYQLIECVVLMTLQKIHCVSYLGNKDGM